MPDVISRETHDEVLWRINRHKARKEYDNHLKFEKDVALLPYDEAKVTIVCNPGVYRRGLYEPKCEDIMPTVNKMIAEGLMCDLGEGKFCLTKAGHDLRHLMDL